MAAVERFASKTTTSWFQRLDQQVFLGDVVDQTSGAEMSVGFGRYGKGERNPWKVTYDEALIVTKGSFTVEGPEGPVTAGVGEVIYLRADTEVLYVANEETELVYVTYPHWLRATENSAEAARLDEFHEA
ncbi:cupin [Kibdelosporangium phytohabitans]|uniref:Cupin n=1 Tax=Kibdelosporangium phytohabitans TaxID=860235 RepID=A0A0N9IBZ0_9PSEU|nr:cupin [Kibdelosporangium phytohabitans]ALG12716.1 cupin [Kibdelosporangium phytohabitans]MBE1464383.1 ethanolamine utilization protein EutQ [Kibdelosporangium phytohabitans]